ncbi:MAG: hypothetical protein PVI86_09615 [Phycisphaerae bacterium]|jgi:hypothetical protein
MSQEPTDEHVNKVMEKVSQIATMADMACQKVPDDHMLVLGFDLGGGRRQAVFLRYLGQTPDGHDIVTFMSPCLEVKKMGFLRGGLSRNQAIDLLRRNAMLGFGSFALTSYAQGREVLMVVTTQLVDTMEVEEFRTHVCFVAAAADEYEREHGYDRF